VETHYPKASANAEAFFCLLENRSFCP
jgi:hypothetical protein